MNAPYPDRSAQYDPWTGAQQCRATVLNWHSSPGADERCRNRTNNPTGLCWRHEGMSA